MSIKEIASKQYYIAVAICFLFPYLTKLFFAYSSNEMLVPEMMSNSATKPLLDKLVSDLPSLAIIFSSVLSVLFIVGSYLFNRYSKNPKFLVVASFISVVCWNLSFCLCKGALLYLAFMSAGETAVSSISNDRAHGLFVNAVVQVAVILLVVATTVGFTVGAFLCKPRPIKSIPSP